jgi:uncharacterized membrane protein YcjF (UPF0283 family)
MSILWSVLIVLVPVIFSALLLRGHLRLDSWSTSDFVPLVACALMGLVIAMVVEFVLEQLFKIDKRILSDGIFSLRSATIVSVALVGALWYKSSSRR